MPTNVAVQAADSGDNTLVAAPNADQFIRVHNLFLYGTAAVNGYLQSGTSGSNLLVGGPSAEFPFTAGGGFENDGGFDCAAGEALVLTLDGAVAVGGNVFYSIVHNGAQ